MDEDKGEEWLAHDINNIVYTFMKLFENTVAYNSEGLPFTTITIFDFAMKCYEKDYDELFNGLLIENIENLALLEIGHHTSRFYYNHVEIVLKQKASRFGDKIKFTFTMNIPTSNIALCA